MGIDAEIYIEGHIELDERTHELISEMLYRHVEGIDQEHIHIGGKPYTRLSCLERYYGPGYERGNWPIICGALQYLMRLYPRNIIRYGDDHTGPEDSQVVTSAWIDGMWTYFFSKDGDNYRRS